MKEPRSLTADQFCLWLSGYVELSGGTVPSFDARQTKAICDKLAKVEVNEPGLDGMGLGEKGK